MTRWSYLLRAALVFVAAILVVALSPVGARAASFGAADGEPSRVQMTATDTAWVRVYDGDGTVLLARDLAPGDTYRVPDRPGLLIDTGNAKALAFAVDGVGGRSIALPQASMIRRSVSLDPDRLGAREQPRAQAAPAVASAPAAIRPETPAPRLPGITVSSPGPEEAPIEIETGKGMVVQLHRAAATVFVSDPDIADVQVKSPSLIYLFGKAPGETSLYAADASDHVLLQAPIRVTHNLSRLREALHQIMPAEPIKVDSVEGAIVLTGNVSSAIHAEDARALAALFTGRASSTAQGGAQAPQQGGTGQPGQAQGASSSGSQVQGGTVLNRLSVIAPNQVNLRVRVAEVNRGTLQALGINWNHMGERILNLATANSAQLASQAVQNILQIGIPLGNNSTLSTELDAMAQEGLITTLAEPNLTAMSGQTASFLAGGEFPIPVAVNSSGGVPTVTVDYKKFGVSIEFLPTVLDGSRVSLRLLSEVSDLSSQGAVQISGFSIPALTVRRAETSVELGSGASFVIAGLLQNNAEHDVSKIPALGDIPILGPLFRSDRFQRQETELVIIVTPYLVQPTAVAAAPTDGLNRPNDLVRPLTGKPYIQTPATPGNITRPAGNGVGLVGPAGFQMD